MKNNQKDIYLSRQAVLAAIIAAAFPIGANAAAGTVQFASGGAALESADGSSKALTKGMEVNQGDTILTGQGRAQVKFSDNSYVSFQPNTQFKIEEYNFNGKQDGTEKGFFKLVQGGLRVITGLVGRENRPNYRLSTPVATIGIRGSYFLAEFKDSLKTHVGHGSIFVFNEQGNIILFEGQGAVVAPGVAPTYSDEQLNLGAKGPEGAQPTQNVAEQQRATETNSIFKVSEQYTETGVSNSVSVPQEAGPSIASIIANLNGINAEATYFLDTSKVNTGSNSLYNTKLSSNSSFVANFGSYSLNGFVGVESLAKNNNSSFVSSSGIFNGFSISGSILPTGSFGATGTSANGICSGSCQLSIIGAFAGAQAERAGISYNIIGVGGGSVNGGRVNGAASFIATPTE